MKRSRLAVLALAACAVLGGTAALTVQGAGASAPSWTHCGTPQAEEDCPTTTTAPATTTTVPAPPTTTVPPAPPVVTPPPAAPPVVVQFNGAG